MEDLKNRSNEINKLKKFLSKLLADKQLKGYIQKERENKDEME